MTATGALAPHLRAGAPVVALPRQQRGSLGVQAPRLHAGRRCPTQRVAMREWTALSLRDRQCQKQQPPPPPMPLQRHTDAKGRAMQPAKQAAASGDVSSMRLPQYSIVL
jgi:hypothetical protein